MDPSKEFVMNGQLHTEEQCSALYKGLEKLVETVRVKKSVIGINERLIPFTAPKHTLFKIMQLAMEEESDLHMSTRVDPSVLVRDMQYEGGRMKIEGHMLHGEVSVRKMVFAYDEMEMFPTEEARSVNRAYLSIMAHQAVLHTLLCCTHRSKHVGKLLKFPVVLNSLIEAFMSAAFVYPSWFMANPLTLAHLCIEEEENPWKENDYTTNEPNL